MLFRSVRPKTFVERRAQASLEPWGFSGSGPGRGRNRVAAIRLSCQITGMFGPSPAIAHMRSGMASRHLPVFQSWVLVVVCALVLGSAAQFYGPRRIPWVEDHSRRVELKAAAEGIEMVDVQRAKEIVGKGEFLVCDARKIEDFDAGHLPGAVSFPFATHEEAYNELAPLFSADQPVMVYCSGRTCDDALMLGKFLRAQGSARVVLFVDGIAGWREAGLPLD